MMIGTTRWASRRWRARGTLLRFEDAHLSTGIRVHYGEQGDPAGPPILLLHGYSDSWFSFSRVLPLMPEQYHVFALDLRGHGDSERPAEGYSMRELAEDVIAFIDDQGIDSATIVGHSMGSFVAQQVALLEPALVDMLVLVGSATEPARITGIGELERTVRTLSDPVPEAFVREFQQSTVHRPLPTDFMERVIAESLKLPASVWHGVMTGMLATARATGLAGVPAPTLILWGGRDAYFPRTEQTALLDLLPRALLKVYPDTGHAPHWERPDQFMQDVVTFMATV